MADAHDYREALFKAFRELQAVRRKLLILEIRRYRLERAIKTLEELTGRR